MFPGCIEINARNAGKNINGDRLPAHAKNEFTIGEVVGEQYLE